MELRFFLLAPILAITLIAIPLVPIPPLHGRASTGSSIRFQAVPVSEFLPLDRLNYINFTVRYTREFTVEAGTDIELRCIRWPDCIFFQDARLISTSHPIERTEVDRHGNEILVLSRIESAEGRSFNVTFTYDVTVWSMDYSGIDPENLGEYDRESETFKRYTRAERYTESDDPRIVNKAREIVGAETNAYRAARALCRWVYDNIPYTEMEETKGALWALENRRGDCTEHAHLFVAFCRALDIPARVIAGFARPELLDGFAGRDPGGHHWAEVYFPHYGWIWVDPTPGWGREWFGHNDLVHIAYNRRGRSEVLWGNWHCLIWRWGPKPSVHTFLEVEVVPVDADGDGLTNLEEHRMGTKALNPDSDGDRLNDGEEVKRQTDPLRADSDGDGLTDGDEVLTYETDPLKTDSDADGLRDGHEVELGTNPLKKDTDGDGLGDGIEVEETKTDPLKADTDDDGLGDKDEIAKGTDPKGADSDGDGLTDGEEVVELETDPLKADSDGDGLSDGVEVEKGANPLNPDSDGDGLKDGEEIDVGTDPLNADTDGDELTDGDEVKHATNPLDEDTDGDGLVDGEEVLTHKSNPTKADTDGDGLMDGEEVLTHETSPSKADTDDDGLTDLKEIIKGTKPTNPDSDADGLRDGHEVELGTNPLKKDTDGDGLEDGREVLDVKTSPLRTDTDGDLWSDSADIAPLNAVMPNGAIVGVAAGVVIGAVLLLKKRKRAEKA